MIDRVDLLRASSTLTGVDFVQISPSQTELLVFLQHTTLPAGLVTALQAISPAQITILGEGRNLPVEDPSTEPLGDHRTALVRLFRD